MNSYQRKINDLPNEMLDHIFLELPRLKQRKVLSLVCRRWYCLAFDYRYMGRLQLRLILDEMDEKKRNALSNPSLCYRNMYIRNYNVMKQILQMASGNCCSECAWKKKQKPVKSILFDNGLPLVLEYLTELDVIDMSQIDVISLAPNLRTLRASSNLENLPTIIQTLPLEKLWLEHYPFLETIDIFDNFTNVTRLTSVVLQSTPIGQKSLEELCKYSPLLTKLCFNASKITTLRCLALLTNLKVYN